jgi:predicted nucleotidyltransferase
MINGVILNKFNYIDEILSGLESLGQITTAQLDADWKMRRAVERDLQIITEIVTDVCQRIISAQPLRVLMPSTDVWQSARCLLLNLIVKWFSFAILSFTDTKRWILRFLWKSSTGDYRISKPFGKKSADMYIEWKILEKTWEKQPNIIAVYVFGSSKDGTVKQGSDVDFGLLFRTKPLLDELAELRAELQEILNIEDIDIIILNDASAILQFEAVCGNCLYSADEMLRAAFVSSAAREYEDTMAMIQRCLMWKM